MKRHLLLIFTLLTSVSLLSCKENEIDPSKQDGKKDNKEDVLTFTGVFEDVSSGDFKTSWSVGDEIQVYGVKGNFSSKEKMKASSVSSDGKTATFVSAGKLLGGAEKFYAFLSGSGVDGYKLKKYWSTESMDRSTAAIPSVVIAACDAEKKEFVFRNVYSLLKFNVIDPSTKDVVLSGNNGEKINRNLFVNFLNFEISDNPKPDFDPTSSIRKSVNGAGTYYIGLFPGLELAGGYTLVAYDESGGIVGKIVDTDPLSVSEGKVIAAGDVAKPQTLSPVFDASQIVLSLAAISDTHVDGVSTAPGTKFKRALEQLKTRAALKDANGIDGVMVVGDLIDNANNLQAQAYKTIYESVFDPAVTPMIYTVGNHDMNPKFTWTSETVAQAQAFSATLGDSYFKTDLDNVMRKNFEARHCVVGGCHILSVTPNATNPITYPMNVLNWLDEQLHALTKADPEKYVIVLTHPMLYNTVYGSLLQDTYTNLGDYWATSALDDILKKYPQVVTFSGHLHFPLNDPRSVWQGDWTSFGCASTKYMAIENGGYEGVSSTPTVMNDANDFSQGILVQFDINGNLRATRMDFFHEAEIGQPWTIAYPSADKSHLNTYSHEARRAANKAPELSPIHVSVGEVANGQASIAVEFPSGADDEFVHHYIVKLSRSDGTILATKKYLADFYKAPQPSGMKPSWSVDFGDQGAGEYVVSIEAYDSWDAAGTYNEAFSIKVPEPPAPVVPEVYADFDFAGGTVVDAKGHITVNNHGAVFAETEVSHAGKTYNVDAMTAKADGYVACKFPMAGTALLDWFDRSFSVEAFYVDKSPGPAVHGIFCSTEKTGWGLAHRATGVPYWIMTELQDGKASGWKTLDAKTANSTTELTHIVVVYDTAGKEVRMYRNGVLEGTLGNMAGHIYTATGAMDWFCLGSDIKSPDTGGDYPNVNTVMVDAKLYAGALNDTGVEKVYNEAVAALNASQVKSMDLWVGDASGVEKYSGGGAALSAEGWLNYANGFVFWTENTTGAPRAATLHFENGSTFKVTQLGPKDFMGAYTVTTKTFAGAGNVRPAKDPDVWDVHIVAPRLGETLVAADGRTFTNNIGVSGLYAGAIAEGCVDIDYAAKTVRAGLFLDGRDGKGQVVNGKYAAFVPSLATRTAQAWAKPWKFDETELGDPDYAWLWFTVSDDLRTFTYANRVNNNVELQELSQYTDPTMNQIIGVSVVLSNTNVFTRSTVSGYAQVYQVNPAGKVGITFVRK